MCHRHSAPTATFTMAGSIARTAAARATSFTTARAFHTAAVTSGTVTAIIADICNAGPDLGGRSFPQRGTAHRRLRFLFSCWSASLKQHESHAQLEFSSAELGLRPGATRRVLCVRHPRRCPMLRMTMLALVAAAALGVSAASAAPANGLVIGAAAYENAPLHEAWWYRRHHHRWWWRHHYRRWWW
jgi:hypothetical protein